MAVEIVKTFVVKATPAAVWAFLTDVARVARCMPGAAIGERIDERTYTGTMTIKVGPVTSTYKGKVVFERLDEVARTAEVVATGQDVRGKGGADLRLTSTLKELAPNETEVTAVSRVNVSGILAQMGRGMIQDVSDQLFQIFSQKVRSELEGAPAASPAPTGPTAPAGPAPPPAAAASAAVAPEALDLGAIGARAAGRAAVRVVKTPVFWLAVLAVIVLVYLLSH